MICGIGALALFVLVIVWCLAYQAKNELRS